MVICPKCGKEFTPKEIRAEEFQAKVAQTKKRLNKAIMFSCPECHVFLDIQR